MSGQHDNTNRYSAAEMLRYLNGQMNRQESHALERAMLSDELLADAVEGYRMMQETMSDEMILQKAGKIQPAVLAPKAKAPVYTLGAYRWVGYAAAACLVIAAGWWILNLSKPGQVLPVPPGENRAADLVISDTGTQKALAGQPADTAAPPNNGQIENTSAKKSAQGKNDLADAGAENTAKQPAATAVPNTNTGNDRPVEVAPAIAKRSAPAAPQSAQAEGRFTLADSASAVPAAGWPAYRSYLLQTLKLPQYAQPGTIGITVAPNGSVVEVTVDGAGEPEKTAIKEAVKKGPAWKNKTAAKAKAAIRFQ